MLNPANLRLTLTRRSLSRFSRAMMPSFEVAPVHKIIIENLEALLAGKIRKLAIVAPPRHGKTLLSNIMLPAFALGRNPAERIISVSYGSELSETWGRRTRNILADLTFREIFPGCQLSPDSAAAYRFETTAGGEYSAVGRGGPVTGKGASLLILDDLIKDASEANSETVCRGTIEWLQSVAFTRLTPDARVLAIGTRWSERDPMGWILQQPGWTILHLPAIAEQNDPLRRNLGEALWPSCYPVEALAAIQSDVGSRVFQCLYQGNVSAAQGTIFRRDWFKRYTEVPAKFEKIIQSWDTSFKSGAQNDFSVGITIGKTETHFYLLGLVRGKWEFPELRRQVGMQAEMWKPHEVLVEDRASGQSLIQELRNSTSYPVIAVQIDRDKETRWASCTGFFESGRILFPEGASWLSDLEDELASVPGSLFDDQADSLCQALNRLRAGSGNELGLIALLKSIATGKRKMPAPRIMSPTAPPAGATLLPAERPEPAKVCPQCGSNLIFPLCNFLKCNQCGFQTPPDAPAPYYAKRNDVLAGRIPGLRKHSPISGNN